MLDLNSLRAQARASETARLPWWARELRTLREQAGLTLVEAGRRANMPYTTWRVIELGLHRPRVDTLERMLAAVGGELEIVQP